MAGTDSYRVLCGQRKFYALSAGSVATMSFSSIAHHIFPELCWHRSVLLVGNIKMFWHDGVAADIFETKGPFVHGSFPRRTEQKISPCPYPNENASRAKEQLVPKP